MDLLEIVMPYLSMIGSNPLLLILGFGVPLALFSYFRKCYPLQISYYVFCVPLVLAVFGLTSTSFAIASIIATFVALFFLIIDAFLIPSAKKFDLSREMVKVASLQKPHRYKIHLSYSGKLRVMVKIKDDFPDHVLCYPGHHALAFEGRKRVEVEFELIPTKRGDVPLSGIHLCIRSRFGLWARYIKVPLEDKLMVYPNLKQLSEYGLLARTNRLSMMGFRKSRRAGQESDFERLRDYTRDDQFKFIDWRSTARRNKLTVRDFQVTQSQRVVFMLDTGRMMVNQSGGLSMLDHALNATLMLAFIALSKGDSVGLLCFSDQVDCYVPPRHDAGQMNRILHTGYNQFPKMVESRYDEAFQFMKERNKRRSLVVLITNVIDEVNANQISKYVSNINGKHLPLTVLLRDKHLYEPLDPVTLQEGGDRYIAAAAADILAWRLQVMTNLLHQGALVLDQFPEDITAPLVNQYLEIKARQLL